MEEKPRMWVPALIGGAAIGVISAVPGLNLINCACCAGVIGGGILAAYLYNRDFPPDQTLSSSDGAVVGLLAGVFGAVIGMVLEAFFGTGYQQISERLLEYSDKLPPEAVDVLERMREQGISAGFMLMGLVFAMVIDVTFGLLGGIIGAAIFRKKKPQP